MTRSSDTAFCPLYREATLSAPWTLTDSAHAGLLFDKFPHAWRFKYGNYDRPGQLVELEFDKGVGPKKTGANSWIDSFARTVGNKSLLNECCERQRQLIQSLGGGVFFLKNRDRFVTGLGRQHPLENSFTWHPTLGVPYLPGSSVKGMVRNWLKQGADENDQPMEGTWMGSPGRVGEFVFFDMLPTSCPTLEVEVMTPHFSPYYQSQESPGDWHSPTPLFFLMVAAEQTWQIGIAPTRPKGERQSAELSLLKQRLLDSFEIAGAGAKTAVGYGRFTYDLSAETTLKELQEKRQKELAAKQKIAAEQAEFENSLRHASPALQAVKKLQRDEKWQQLPGDQKMLNSITQLADQQTNFPQDFLAWIRDWLEGMPNYSGVWESPDAMTGKKQDKFKYGSKAVRELVKKLKSPRSGHEA